MTLKYFLVLLLVFSLFFLHCEKQVAEECPPTLVKAMIIGQDFRRCACCGGWIIDLGQDTVRTLSLPATFEIDPLPDLPIEVCLSFEAETGPCKGFEKLIVVEEIVRR